MDKKKVLIYFLVVFVVLLDKILTLYAFYVVGIPISYETNEQVRVLLENELYFEYISLTVMQISFLILIVQSGFLLKDKIKIKYIEYAFPITHIIFFIVFAIINNIYVILTF